MNQYDGCFGTEKEGDSIIINVDPHRLLTAVSGPQPALSLIEYGVMYAYVQPMYAPIVHFSNILATQVDLIHWNCIGIFFKFFSTGVKNLLGIYGNREREAFTVLVRENYLHSLVGINYFLVVSTDFSHTYQFHAYGNSKMLASNFWFLAL